MLRDLGSASESQATVRTTPSQKTDITADQIQPDARDIAT
jgi:hypothetical protein